MAHALDVERARATLESLEADVREEAGVNQVPELPVASVRTHSRLLAAWALLKHVPGCIFHCTLAAKSASDTPFRTIMGQVSAPIFRASAGPAGDHPVLACAAATIIRRVGQKRTTPGAAGAGGGAAGGGCGAVRSVR